jgi:signal recognition particle subunit SRP54
MASRILGMGDMLTLIEKAQDAFSEEEALKLQKKLKERSFTLSDYLMQIESMKKMGGLKEMMAMLPGAGKLNVNDIDENKILHTKAIIQSMTVYEREHPDTIKSSQKKRIAAGSGTTIQDINQLLKQFEMSRDMMKQMTSGKRMKMPFGLR